MSLQDEERFPLLDNDQNTMTPLLRALQGIPLDGPLQNHLQQFFVQKLLENKFLAKNFVSHWVKYGPEVEWVLTLFDPLCPDLASQGPTPLVIRSTFGGLPNHAPMMLVRSSIPDL